MDKDRMMRLKELELKLGIEFKDKELLNRAFIHSSYVNESMEEFEDNEKLELLGDSVYGFIVVDYLYRTLMDKDEGELSRIKSAVVSDDNLYKIATDLGFRDYLLLGRGESLAYGRYIKKSLSDSFEALIGAYYLDRGLEAVRELVLSVIKGYVEIGVKDRYLEDYKTKLQHILQKKYKICPIYKTLMEEGPDHRKVFLIQALANDHILGTGTGASKKLAQQSAAQSAIQFLDSEEFNENSIGM